MELVQWGVLVVAKEDYYEGLAGHISSLEPDPAGTCNEDLENTVIVDLFETEDMEKTHPNLNGTGVTDLYMGTDELIFFPNGKNEVGYDLEGKEYKFKDVACAYDKETMEHFR